MVGRLNSVNWDKPFNDVGVGAVDLGGEFPTKLATGRNSVQVARHWFPARPTRDANLEGKLARLIGIHRDIDLAVPWEARLLA